MALFTGKGDDGTTKVFGCDQQRISKSSELPEALGALDELNTFIGFVKLRAMNDSRICDILHNTQEQLFIVQAEIAGADKHLESNTVEKIETIVNDIEKEMPPLKGFSISGGSELSTLLDVLRTMTRRAERTLICVENAKLCELTQLTKAYMNRLSSLFFALARQTNARSGISEENPRY